MQCRYEEVRGTSMAEAQTTIESAGFAFADGGKAATNQTEETFLVHYSQFLIGAANWVRHHAANDVRDLQLLEQLLNDQLGCRQRYSVWSRTALENVDVALRAASAELEGVLSTRVLAASSIQIDLLDAEAAVLEAFGKNDAPRRLREVTILGHNTDQLIEIEPVEVWAWFCAADCGCRFSALTIQANCSSFSM